MVTSSVPNGKGTSLLNYKHNKYLLFSFLILIFHPITKAQTSQIGLVYRADQWQKYKAGDDPLKNYSQLIQKHNAVPVPIYEGEKIEEINNVIPTLKGIVFPGGDDLLPLFFNDKKTATVQNDFYIYTKAIEHKIPLLGICRGMQLLNVFNHGELYTSIAKEVGTKVIHRNQDSSPLHHHAKFESEIKTITINSYHFQGVKKLGDELNVILKSSDGIIEAYEKFSTPYILGLQFHPEKEDSPEMNAVVDRFFQKIK